MNSSSQSQHQQQTVNASSRRVLSSGVSSFHHQHQTQTNETKQLSSTQHVKSNLTEMQSRISQMKALSQQTTTSSTSSSSSASATSSTTNSINSQKGLTPLKLMTDQKLMNACGKPLT